VAAAALDANVPAARRTNVRWQIIVLLFIVTTIAYADRATFSIAGASASKEMGLSPVAMGYILSAFAWAYVLGQIPGGALLDKFGSKRIYGAAIAIWSVFTVAQGLTVGLIGATAVVVLFALRFLVGLAEAPSFPGNARIVAAWFPKSERGTASAIFNSAQYFSLVAFAPLMGWIAHSFQWRWVFVVMGCFGFAAAAVFMRFIHSPSRHPKVNAAEIAYIEDGGGLVRMDEEAMVAAPSLFTWANVRQLLTSRMMIGIYLAQYCINVLTYFFVTWFPIYLVKERGLNIMEAGFAAVAPALCGFIGGVLGGYISDLLLKRTGSTTFARKAPILIGMLLASLIISCVYIEQEWLIVTMMAVSFFGKGVASLGWAVVSDTAPPSLAGVTGGVFNTFGNIAGIVTPIVIGYIVEGTGSFDGALIFVGAHCALTIVAYFLVVGKIERLELKS
jgi:ACS family glucarate transporter-like MFS transporter